LNVIYALAGLSAFCAVVVLGALAYYLKLRRAERSTPPALAN
jgi:hypothetical protein